MYKTLIIKAPAPRDADYEMITDTAIHNTLKEYWKWAEETGVNLQFQVKYPDEQEYYSDESMHVYAEFNTEQDYNDFTICHIWQLPKTELNLASEDWRYEFAGKPA